jgi:hypothetical protein
MQLLIPTGVDLSGLSRTEADTGAYLLSILARKSITSGNDITTPQKLHRDILKALGGSRYRDLISVLLHRKIISEDIWYCPGYSSKRYRIVNNSKLDKYQVTDKLALKRIASARQIQTKYTLLVNPHLQGQFEFIKGLTLDAPNALKQVKSTYGYLNLIDGYKKLIRAYGAPVARQVAAAFINSDSREKKRLSRQLKFTSEQYKWLKRNAEKYRKLKKRITEILSWEELRKSVKKDKWVRMTTSKRTGRLFTNVTSAPKDVRKELKYNGESLVEIDATSAQWALLVKFLEMPHISNSKNNKEGNLFNQEQEAGGVGSKDHHQAVTKYKGVPPHHYMWHFLKSELVKLRELVSSGTFNAYMHQRIHEVGNALNVGGQRPTLFKLPETVKETKLLLISRVLFEDPRRQYLQDELAYITFKREFPNVLRCIEYLKTDGYMVAAGEMPTGNKPYSALALRLQSMEADIFVNLLPKYTKQPYCTIHDAVLTPESCAGHLLSDLERLLRENRLPILMKQ